MISRRNFLTRAMQGLGISMVLPPIQSCTTSSSSGEIKGPNAALGHRLRSMDFDKPVETIYTGTLIIGGGVAGLSAARYLKKFTNDFLLIELEDKVGGNSMGGTNNISSFPWGAHYLPLPGDNDPELISFLKEADVITGSKNGLPVFNEYYLCHDPKERLYINHYWQEGLIPHEGIPQKDRHEIDRFLSMMQEYKQLKGNDGRDAFAIPLSRCSSDKSITGLDTITAIEFLNNHKFSSAYLRWYINYCCADDYGSSSNETSAWAMIHYFASRKGVGANASPDSVLTWPEGNYWLVKQLKKNISTHIESNMLAYHVNLIGNGVEVLVYDAIKNVSKKIIAKSTILATPQFINQHLLKTIARNVDYQQFQYAPWMVANLTINTSLEERRGINLCWDNVIYGSNSLGYVNATHQQIGFHNNQKIITYYKPLLDRNSSNARRMANSKTFEQWKVEVVNDLIIPHQNIDSHIQNMDVWLWGHGMIKPSRGFIWSNNRLEALLPIEQKIFFAHSDLSGISIFEEAFHQGHKSAKAVLNHEF